ncbi:MAG: hypothetical protein ACFCGT_18650 [Sandaracinaceae bacterium]
MSRIDVAKDYSPAEIDRIKAELWTEVEDGAETRALDARDARAELVAEGDSWFSYPLGFEVLDHLQDLGRYRVRRFAEAGDTLENLTYGTEVRGGWQRRPPQLDRVLEAIAKTRPRAFLFSGGGNDIAGEELSAFLNHAGSRLAPLRRSYAEYAIGTSFRRAYEHLFERVWSVAPSLPIISHGYAYAIPDGRGYRRLAIRWSGPWLRPHLVAKGHESVREGRRIIRDLIDLFNEMLQDLSAQHAHFHHVDVRTVVADGDWENELHLDGRGFGKVAEAFDRVIQTLP